MNQSDEKNSRGQLITSLPGSAMAITPGTGVFEHPVAVYVGGEGNVTVIPADSGDVVVFTEVPAGMVLPVMVRAVLAATTATGLVGVY